MKPHNCPICKQKNWIDFDIDYVCGTDECEFNINKQKHQIDKKVLRQRRNFSTRLQYANKEFRKIYFSVVNTKYNSTQDLINKLQQLKAKTKVSFFYQNISKDHEEMNYHRKNATFLSVKILSIEISWL